MSPPPPPETFRSHLPALAGTVAGTLIAAVIGHYFFGKTGTAYALIGSSALTGTASWWTERAIRRSRAIARAKLEALKKKGSPLTLGETQVIEAVGRGNFDFRFKGIHYRTIFLLALSAFLVAFLTVLILDQFGTRPASYTPPPAAPAVTQTTYVPVAPSYIPSSSYPATAGTKTKAGAPSSSASPSASPSPSPDPSPSAAVTPSASVTPFSLPS